MIPFRPLLFALAVGAPVAGQSVAATASPQPTLAAFKDHSRVVVMFAPTPDNALFAAQTVQLAALTKQPTFRSLIVVGVAGNAVIGVSDTAEALRRRFGVAPGAFEVVLVGKDGTVALSDTKVVTAQRLATTIDAMPMRKAELRRGDAS